MLSTKELARIIYHDMKKKAPERQGSGTEKKGNTKA